MSRPSAVSTDEKIVQPREDRSVLRVRPFARRAAPFALAFEPFAIVDRGSSRRRGQRRGDRAGRSGRWTVHAHFERSWDQGIHGPSLGNRLALACAIPHNRLVGIDDLDDAKLLPVPLTTLRQPTREIGAAAFAAMIDRVSRPDAPVRDILLQTDWVVRRSCGGRV